MEKGVPGNDGVSGKVGVRMSDSKQMDRNWFEVRREYQVMMGFLVKWECFGIGVRVFCKWRDNGLRQEECTG